MTLSIGPYLPVVPLLPLLVFLAETCVLTLATIRTIFIARGKKVPAALLGFCEVAIWLFAIGQVMQNLSDMSCSVAFAAGFSLGNYLGVSIEQKLALGNLSVQITTSRDVSPLVEELLRAGYGVTKLNGQGATGPVEIVVTVVQRKNLANVTSIVQRFDPNAFYSVHDLQSAAEGVFRKRPASSPIPIPILRLLRVFSNRIKRPASVAINQ